MPGRQGKFKLYFLEHGGTIAGVWYLSEHSNDFSPEDDLADVRVLMQSCINEGGGACKFIIATNDDLGDCRKKIMEIFRKMKVKLPARYRKGFELEMWDDPGLLRVEKSLGLRVDL